MAFIDYSNVTSLNGYSASSLTTESISYFLQSEGGSFEPLIGYNVGTVEILQQLQTVNFLLCVLIFLGFILTTVVCYVQLIGWFRRSYKGR